jgi:hypothetical protein
MKSLMTIAQDCNMRYNDLKSSIKNLNLEPAKREGRRILFDKKQEDYIHLILYFEGKITEITLESKINFDNNI